MESTVRIVACDARPARRTSPCGSFLRESLGQPRRVPPGPLPRLPVDEAQVLRVLRVVAQAGEPQFPVTDIAHAHVLTGFPEGKAEGVPVLEGKDAPGVVSHM